MNYFGDFAEDATVYVPFNTFDSNDPSASVTITDLATGDVEIYKDGVIQATPGAGVTLSLNVGANSGSHLIAVDTSNTTDAGFYVINADYQVRINGTTIDAATVNAWVGTFSIENRFTEVDVTAISGDTTAADNLELFTEVLESGTGLIDAGTFKAAAIDSTAIADNAITAAKINADAITNAKIADDAIGAENLATDAISADALSSGAVDEIWAKAMSDLAQGAPSATASVFTAINYLYEAWRNKTTTTATLITVLKDDGSTGLVKSTISDDSTTFSKSEFITGA